MAIKLAILTTAFFPNIRPLRMFVASAIKYGYDPIQFMGLRQQYRPWAEMKIKDKIPEFQRLIYAGFTHVLYSDARDAFFTGPYSEVLEKYQTMGSPSCLASTEPNCNPNSAMDYYYPDVGKYRYHCVGGYLAELPWMLNKFTRMLPYMAKSGDDAEIWQWGWEEGWFRPELDSGCEIFQTLDHAENDLGVNDIGRLENMVTSSFPCIFHLNGGYSDPITGKYDHMIEWWNRLNPELPLTKKECSL